MATGGRPSAITSTRLYAFGGARLMLCMAFRFRTAFTIFWMCSGARFPAKVLTGILRRNEGCHISLSTKDRPELDICQESNLRLISRRFCPEGIAFELYSACCSCLWGESKLNWSIPPIQAGSHRTVKRQTHTAPGGLRGVHEYLTDMGVPEI